MGEDNQIVGHSLFLSGGIISLSYLLRGIPMVQPTRTRITAREYYQLPDYKQNDLIQLINGEVIIGMPPMLKHKDIVREILIILALIARKLGGKAYDSPIEVRLDDNNVFEPDVLYIQPDNLAITQQDEKRIVGAPNLVVEVLSPSTAKFDRQEKYQAYEQHGVNEYWIVDPVYEVVEVWNLGQHSQAIITFCLPRDLHCTKSLHLNTDLLKWMNTPLHNQGMSYRVIGKILDIHWTRVGQIIKHTK